MKPKVLFYDINIVYLVTSRKVQLLQAAGRVRSMMTFKEVRVKLFGGWLRMWKDLEGDKIHVVLLIFLYCLQGIPIGKFC